MKKILFVALILTVIAMMPAVFAQEEITAKDLGIENPGILPTSPFYFFKNIMRNMKRIFTVNPIKKAELELDIANQQAAEIKKVEEIYPERVDAILKATANYQTNVERLKNRLEDLKETSQNPNIDKLVEKLADQSIKHQQFFDELKSKFEDNDELKQRIEAAQERVSETVAKIPEKFDSSEMFRERIEKILKVRPEGVVNELKRIEIIDRISDKIPAEQRKEIEAMKENMMKEFGDRIENLPTLQKQEIFKPGFLEMIPGNAEQRVRILEEIKNQTGSLEIRGKIMEAGEKILENKIEKQEIKKEDVLKMMEYVKSLIVRAENAVITIDDGELKAKRQKLLEEIKLRLSRAETVLNEGKIGEAFGMVNSVGAEVKKFLIPSVEAIKPMIKIIEPTIDAIKPIEINKPNMGVATSSGPLMPIPSVVKPIQPVYPDKSGVNIQSIFGPAIPEIPLMPKY
ncbi:MAG: DUF5667 domain-containing protein [Patescibacteria group bacterium]